MLEYLAVVGVMFAGIYACTRLLVWFVFGTPPRPPLSTKERFEVETRLMAAGMRW